MSRITHPIRQFARTWYWRLPLGWREALVDVSYRVAGPLFAGWPSYEIWSGRQVDERLTRDLAEPNRPVRLDIPALGRAPGRIAIHAHVFYLDLSGEFARHLRNMPFDYDLFVSVTDEEAHAQCLRAFGGLPHLKGLEVEVVPNRGRDIAPMFCRFGQRLRDYDFVAHIHTKKSLYNKGATTGWREYLLDGLLGSRSQIRRVFSLLHSGAGLVYPQSFHRVPYTANCWMANRGHGHAWCERMGIREIPGGYFDFPVGSMFWARGDALRPLFEAGIRLEDFAPEDGQKDGTFAHALERLLGVVTRASGRRIDILLDEAQPSWSPWRLEQYARRRLDHSMQVVQSVDVRLVAFDIFDTLLTRPLIDPEMVKAIVARRAGAELGPLYLRWRAEAERSARAAAGRDVALPEILRELGRLAELDGDAVRLLQELEIGVELASVGPRPDALALFRQALDYGKRVVLASDMFLPVATIEEMLRRHGFAGWHALYVSSDIGVRKDSGWLYARILEDEGIAPERALMVGDNEASDLQLPHDLGWRTFHVLRPVELARSLVRFAPLIEQVERGGDVDAHLGLGLLTRRLFGGLHYPHWFDAGSLTLRPDGRSIGYAICGPLVFAFSQWLIEQAARHGTDRLYFLAREGQFLKQVYDRVAQTVSGAPAATYLVVSRRALNVPSISTLDQVLTIAKPFFGPAPLRMFLFERFGLTLESGLERRLIADGVFDPDQELEIRDDDTTGVRPLLEALLPAILAEGEQERPALLAYLHEQGLADAGKVAVVDVGFSGTIQRGLNALLQRPIDGFYMATLDRTLPMEQDYGVVARGAFHEHAPDDDHPVFVRLSFYIEKMLSADDTQLLKYTLDAAGRAQPQFRPLDPEEEDVFALRASIRAGTMQFVEDALRAQDELLPDFRYPLDLAERLFETFANEMSPNERRVLSGVVLDDYYCGRGLVRN